MITLPIKLSEHIDLQNSPKAKKHSVETNEDFQGYLSKNIKKEIERTPYGKEPGTLNKLSVTKKQKNIEAEPLSKTSGKKPKMAKSEISAEKFLQQSGLSQDEINKISHALNIDLKETSSSDLFEALKFDEEKINEIISTDLKPEDLIDELLLAASLQTDGRVQVKELSDSDEHTGKNIELLNQIPADVEILSQTEQKPLKGAENKISVETLLQNAGLSQDEIDKIGKALENEMSAETLLQNAGLSQDEIDKIGQALKNEISAETLLQNVGLSQDEINKIGQALKMDLKEYSSLDFIEILKKANINKTISANTVDQNPILKQGSSNNNLSNQANLQLENPQIDTLSVSTLESNGKEIAQKKKESPVLSSTFPGMLEEEGEQDSNNKAGLSNKQTAVNSGENLFFQNKLSHTDEEVKMGLLKDESPGTSSTTEDDGNLYLSKNSSETVEISTKVDEKPVPDSLLAKRVVTQITKKIGSLTGINIGHKEISFRLHPKELGSLNLKIQSEMQSVKISIITENSATKQILESNLGELKKSLLDQGINTEQLTISVGTRDEGPKEQRNFYQAMLQESESFSENITSSKQDHISTANEYFVNRNSINIIA